MQDYSLLRGPCPEGFHVPISTEWQDIIQMIGSLGLDASLPDTYITNIKLQYRGYIDIYQWEEVIDRINRNIYRCANQYDGNAQYAYAFELWNRSGSDPKIASVTNIGKSYGCSIRPFKNEPVIPDNTWTVLYDGSSIAAGAGTFRNQGLGLVSISNDGFNWITISDTDLSSNQGSYYQRGNNFGFPSYTDGGDTGKSADTTGYGPGNYYSSGVLIRPGSTGRGARDSPINPNLWGYESFILDQNDIFLGAGPGVLKNADTQGPCQDWFHVPTLEECSKLFDMYRNMLGEGGVNFMTYFHFPTMGYLSPTIGEPSAQTWGYYWTSQIASYEGTNYNNANYYGFTSNNILEASSSGRSTSHGLPIRPFRNAPVIPDDTWTASYDISTDTKKVGIFWDQSRGLISISSNGTDWITIADKNLGATQVYNYGDTVSETNAGGYFQWGNNYMFPFAGAGTVVTSTTNARNYGPGNYYSSDIYRGRGAFSWDSSKNKNLWGGETNNMGYKKLEIYIGEEKFKNDRTLLQGPCESGFHVPTYPEWFYFYKVLDNIGVPKGDWWRINLHMPFAGMRNFNTGEKDKEGTWCYYRSSSLHSSSSSYPRRASSCCFDSSTLYWNSLQEPASALFIRPFRNKTIRPNSSLTGWTVLFDGSSYAEGAGVFQRQSDGLITAYDGERTYTISDKNCGATVAYNDGDTLSQANCGYCYQRGNNYGFPWTGSLTNISSTKVDVLDYGPYNPYYGDTFITTAIQSNRAEVRNEDLWGYISYYDNYPSNVAEVYKGTTLVRSNYKPIVPAIGVYWNPTKGLISLSDDGKKWMTISDRNLGAKRAYNSGDEITKDNVGYLFQGGNNYPFDYTKTIATTSTQVNTSSYGPSSYRNKNFVTGCTETNPWATGYNSLNLRGGDSPKLGSIKGPCSDGFHVPTYTERGYLLNRLNARGISNVNTFKQYLKIPLMGRIRKDNGSKITGVGEYWSSTHVDYGNHDQSALNLKIESDLSLERESIANGYSIRPFKNEAIEPDNTWTKLYTGTQSHIHSGIFHNATLGLITISDYTQGRAITISDKNLGATVVYNDGDTMSESNCGGFFQYGNNYMFPFTGPTATSSTLVDATGYGPGNYYSSSTFITLNSARYNDGWMTSLNENIRGYLDTDYKKAIGPCNIGWHIPTRLDALNIKDMLENIRNINSSFDVRQCLKILTNQIYIKTDGTISNYSNYETSLLANSVSYQKTYSSGTAWNTNQRCIDISTTGVGNTTTQYGFPIRPFKNEPVVPNDTSRIKLA